LIERLTAQAAPVRRLLDPLRRASLWVAVAAVCVCLGLVHFGIRHDMAAMWHSPGFLLRIGLLISTMWLSVVTAFRLAVPGREGRVWARWLPIVALAALVAIAAGEVVSAAMTGTMGSPLRSWLCIRKVAFVGIVPAGLAVFLIQRAATLEPRWTALLGVLAAGAAGALTAEIACPIKPPLHILLWHIMPVALSAGIGVLIGSALLQWTRSRC
jgi:hypothetical protein